jgi:TetR/AcrR family transcriptional repressor of mexJK operon
MHTVIRETEPEAKVDFILKAAQKRLGLYGYEKTTMQEIAADIAMSKAAVYYYFPDKESLFKAVIENEQEEFFQLLDQRMSEITDADQMIMVLVELRHNIFRKFLNLSKFRLSENHKIKPLLLEPYNKLREKETDILVTIFNKGRESGIFYFDDAAELATLFSDILQGIRFMEMKKIQSIEMTADENIHMLKMLRQATKLFINGLKYNKLQQPIQ